MKTVIIILCFCWMSTSLQAQLNKSGIYMSADDFISGTLTLGANCNDEKYKIKINSFLNSSYVTVTYQGKKHNFNKADIFGYKDCSLKVFRFFKGEEYQIINEKTIYLYTQRQIQNESKSSNVETHYYFSTEFNASILPLTINAIKKAFPDNHVLHDMLDSRIKNDSELVKYNNHNKSYELVHLIDESQKSK